VSHSFEDFERTAFRLEARPIYMVEREAEAFRRYLAGEPLPSAADALTDWEALVRRSTAGGRVISRVHAIEGPLTPYLRFEIDWGYPYTAAAGEQIAILHRDSLREVFGADTPPPDFWLFDDERVLWMEYDDAGRFVGSEESSDPQDIARCVRLRSVALEHALTLRAYMAALRLAPIAPLAVPSAA